MRLHLVVLQDNLNKIQCIVSAIFVSLIAFIAVSCGKEFLDEIIEANFRPSILEYADVIYGSVSAIAGLGTGGLMYRFRKKP